MQSSLRRLTIISGCALAPLARADGPGPINDPVPNPLVSVGVQRVFVPVGFDDNDEVEAVVDGYLPDSCYKVAFNEAKFDQGTKAFTVTQWARKRTGFCLNMAVPFFSEVHLGVVPAGAYKVLVAGAASQSLTVKEATSAGPDDFIYAPVDSAYVDADSDQHTYTAILTGRFTNSCMQWDAPRFTDHGSTIEVLPIMKMADGPDCHATEQAYTKSFLLPATMTAGRHLLHVRSLNGQALNDVFTVYPH